jgi:Predicted dehydrogenases and related proteins
MLESKGIDLVVISTPPNSHYSWAKKALALGIHVILEKPMALNALSAMNSWHLQRAPV